MRIILYILIIWLGAYLGFKDKLPNKIVVHLSKLQYWSLLFLLFVMGINIGINDKVINTFYQLGYQALVLSFFSIIMSVLGVRLISRFVKTKDIGSEKSER